LTFDRESQELDVLSETTGPPHEFRIERIRDAERG
jgi:hypothetical protein